MRLPLIVDKDELDTAEGDGAINLHDWINLSIQITEVENTSFGNANDKVIRTTVGRVYLQ